MSNLEQAKSKTSDAQEGGWAPDLVGGLLAGVVALPLALAFGVASGMGASAGLVGAIVLGIVAAVLGGTPVQVSGPTGPMTVVVAAVVAAHSGDPKTVAAAVILAGLIQVAMGVMRLGGYIQYVPYPVVSGFMTGIGVIIICLQLPVLLGAKGQSAVVASLKLLPQALGQVNGAALALGLGTVAIAMGLPKLIQRLPLPAEGGLSTFAKKLPASLVALVAMGLLAYLAQLKVPVIGPVSASLGTLVFPGLDPKVWVAVLPEAFALAALGSIDSLLTSLVADRMTRTQHQSDRELLGQGVGNALSGVLGGIPGAGATMRTVIAIQSGARGRLAGVTHGLFLLAVALGLGALTQHIPLAVLAGLLLTVGWGIIDWRGLNHLPKVPRADAVVTLTVLFMTVFVDLIQAVGVGMVMACLVYVKRMSDRELAHSKEVAQPDEDWVGVSSVHGEVAKLTLKADLFFGNAKALSEWVAQAKGLHALVVDLRASHYLDQSGAYALADFAEAVEAQGTKVYLLGAHDQPERVLRLTGVAPGELPADRLCADMDTALRRIWTAESAGKLAPLEA